MSDYDVAYAAYNAAFAIYDPIRLGYLAGKVSDAQFLAAKASFDKVLAAYDAAYIVAQDAGEPEEVDAGDDAEQLNLF